MQKLLTRQKSILRRLMIPMTFLIMLQIFVMGGIIFYGGFVEQLEQNAIDILAERVSNRGNYLQDEMCSRWSNVNYAVETINSKTQALVDDGRIQLDQLDRDSASYDLLLKETYGDIITLIRTNMVSGAFLVLNRENLDDHSDRTEIQKKPGIYIRDTDPTVFSSEKNNDLLVQRAPLNVMQQLEIPSDSCWKPQFEFQTDTMDYYPFFYQPYQQALQHPDLNEKDLGYWSGPYHLFNDNKQVISYSVPLVLKDGTVYGVLGVEVSLDYFVKALPYTEINDDKKGAYVVAIGREGMLEFDKVAVNGPNISRLSDSSAQISFSSEKEYQKVYQVESKGSSDLPHAYGYITELSLYNSNTPFEKDRWVLIGLASEQELFAFSKDISVSMVIVVLVNLLIGFIAVLLISFSVARPIVNMSVSLKNADSTGVVSLTKTNIFEIDLLGNAVEKLSQEVYEASSKFTQMLDMASVKLGGFEIDLAQNSLFVTENFFEIFHRPELDKKQMSISQFQDILRQFESFIVDKHLDNQNGKENYSYVYKIPIGETKNSWGWISLKSFRQQDSWIGLAEDITLEQQNLERIEYERDHDALTDLINRRAFDWKMRMLFEHQREKLGIAALLMLDLDNLKYLNDTYGHDYGDRYIQIAARTLLNAAPEGALVARLSGDEFYWFLYGYQDKETIRGYLRGLQEQIYQHYLVLPDNHHYRLRASGGIAWYPDDSADYDELRKYADFAMYKMKKGFKGEFGEFDFNAYEEESYLLHNKEEFNKLLEEGLVEYHFQPIVNAHTGEIYAYEALMRSLLPSFKSPQEISELARLEFKLDKIERLTWFKAMEAFRGHLLHQRIAPHCKVFINSLPNQLLSEEDAWQFEQLYAEYLPLIVQEIIEEEKINDDIRRRKTERARRWQGEIALDDYGSGYNSERILLSLSPTYVKIDLDIIQGIDTDVDKQKIVENLISYAHERQIYVIAEGVETEAELEKTISMGIDFLQGYYLARPAVQPPKIPEAVQIKIQSFAQKYGFAK